MSELARKVGQLLWCGFDGVVPPQAFLRRVADGEVGAAVLFKRNLGAVEEILALNAALHAAAPSETPLLVAVDQEGGRVQRVRAPATEWPPALRLGELEDEEGAVALAEQVGRALGGELAVLGFDLDFAPVLDVHTNPGNPIIGDRAFATTPERVIALAGAFARGLRAAGVIPCGKHFPGHGDTSVDSHLALPRVDHALERLRAVELAPFRALAAELPILMTAHVVFAALDDAVPATLSPAVLEGLLRGELGYGGLILSDDLEMKAILDHVGAAEAAVRGLGAGCDAFLVCAREDLQLEVLEALVRAAEGSAELRARVEQAAARVAALKAAHVFGEPETAGRAHERLGTAANRALARRMSGS